MNNEIIVNFTNIVKNNYANFDGRARRKEFWYFVLANIAISIIFSVLAGIFATFSSTLATIIYIIYGIVALGLIIPGIAVGVRRLHDTNKSGWFLLLSVVPFGNLYLLYLYVLEGDKYDNTYGADPKTNENKF